MSNVKVTVPLSIDVSATTYQQIAEIAEKVERTIVEFIRNPKLECWYCPCGDKDRNVCEGAGDGSCIATLYKFIFSGDETA